MKVGDDQIIMASLYAMTNALDQSRGVTAMPAVERSELDSECIDEARLWAFKREQQRRDLAALTAHQATEDAMSWFSGGRARACRLVDSPY